MFCVTVWGEDGKNSEDKIKTGQMIGGVEWNLSGAYLLWRGAAMKEEWITPFQKKVGNSFINLPGNTSCSRDPKIALGFALNNINAD